METIYHTRLLKALHRFDFSQALAIESNLREKEALNLYRRYFNRLTLRYLLALLLVAGLSLLSYLMLHTAIHEHESSAATLNFSGKRRFLSQKIAFHSLSLVDAPRLQERVRERALLVAAATELENAHEGLLHGDSALGLTGALSPAMKSFYFTGPDPADPLIREYIQLARTWATLPDSELQRNHPVLARLLALGPNRLLKKLNDAVTLYQGEAEAETRRLQKLETGVFGTTLLLLYLEALFIFQPMVRSLISGIEEREKSRKFLDAVINALPDPVFVKDEEHRWLLLNDRFCEFIGQGREKILGKSDYDFFPKDSADLCWEMDRQAFSANQVIENEEKLRDSQGHERDVLVKKTIVRDPSGRLVLVAALRDITQLRAAERELDASQLETMQASKMAALGEMAAGIAHEIKNPLTVIAMRASLIANMAGHGIMDPASILEHSSKIEERAADMNRIINSLRSLSRFDFHDEQEQVLLSRVLFDVRDICQERLKHHEIKLSLEPAAEGVHALCHPSQLRQVLLNLVSNSMDAVQGLDERWIRINATDRGEFLEISVTDSGAGINPELREKILNPFFTTKAVGQGTGLGLTISRRLIERHRGHLSLDTSAANTRFLITLPKA